MQNNMFNNNPRDRGNLGGVPVRDNYYNNGPTPAQFIDNMQDRCLFTRNNNNFQNVIQDNKIGFDNSLKSDNRGMFLHENNYVNRPLLDNNLNEAVRNEYIDERDIIIDTIDRDISVYPNIFNFTLKLGSTDTTAGPSIHRSIQNVKYLKLIKCVFPDNYWINKTTFDDDNLDTAIQHFVTNVGGSITNNDTSYYDSKYTHSNGEIIYIIYYPPKLQTVYTSSSTDTTYDLGISETLATSNISISATSGDVTIQISGLTSNSLDLSTDDVIEISGSTNFDFYYKVISISSTTLNTSSPYSANSIYKSYTFTITCGKSGLTAAEETSGLTINKYANAYEQTKFFYDFYRDVSGEPDYTNIYQVVLTDTLKNGTVTESNLYTTSSDCQIEKGRFYQLHIDQLPKNNDLATGEKIRNSFSLLYPSTENSRGYNILDGLETDKIFRFSNLGSFTNFTIKILDSAGDQIENNQTIWNYGLDNIDSKSKIENTNSISSTTYDSSNGTLEGTRTDYKYSFRSPSKYLRHPLSWVMQAQFIFTVGEVQIEMNKKTFN